MLFQLAKKTEILLMDDNLIAELTLLNGTKSAFGDLVHLKTLSVRCNRIDKGLTRENFTSLGNLTRLDLFNNSIPSVAKAAFADSPLLLTINLAYNNISQLQSGCFLGLARLLTLDLSGNALTTVDRDVFGGLVTLQNLLLANNQIVSLPLNMDWPRIRTINLSFNELTHLSETHFQGYRQLSFVNISYNKLKRPVVFVTNVTRLLIDASHNQWESACATWRALIGEGLSSGTRLRCSQRGEYTVAVMAARDSRLCTLSTDAQPLAERAIFARWCETKGGDGPRVIYVAAGLGAGILGALLAVATVLLGQKRPGKKEREISDAAEPPAAACHAYCGVSLAVALPGNDASETDDRLYSEIGVGVTRSERPTETPNDALQHPYAFAEDPPNVAEASDHAQENEYCFPTGQSLPREAKADKVQPRKGLHRPSPPMPVLHEANPNGQGWTGGGATDGGYEMPIAFQRVSYIEFG